jgi:hypothetical protein
MKVAQQIVETLLEGDDNKKMPPWLQKKISGKSDEDEGKSKGKEDEGDDEPAKEKSASSTATDVAGGPKKAKDGDKVEHTF